VVEPSDTTGFDRLNVYDPGGVTASDNMRHSARVEMLRPLRGRIIRIKFPGVSLRSTPG